MGYLPAELSKHESVAEAVCGAFLGSCEPFKSKNGFRVKLQGTQTVAFYWRANEPDNWGELAMNPAPLAANISKSIQFLKDWMQRQISMGGDRKCAIHKEWVTKVPWPIIGFANRSELDTFIASYRALRDPFAVVKMPSATQQPAADDPLKGVAAKLLEDFRNLVASGGAETTREAIRIERIGQSLLRPVVLDMWDKRCALTGVKHAALIVTSHIKPWAHSTELERLDPYNALPLAAHIDAAFDAGLISFHNDGRIILASELSHEDLDVLGLSPDSRLRHPPDADFLKYLDWHRSSVLRDAA